MEDHKMKTGINISKSGRVLIATIIISCFSFGAMAQTQQTTGLAGYRDMPTGIVDNTNSSQSVTEISRLNVYYSAGECNVRFQKPADDNVNIKIYDISGRLIMSDIAMSSETNIDRKYSLSGLENGIYILQVYSEKQILSKKFYL